MHLMTCTLIAADANHHEIVTAFTEVGGHRSALTG
jgi:hypothetical protein